MCNTQHLYQTNTTPYISLYEQKMKPVITIITSRQLQQSKENTWYATRLHDMFTTHMQTMKLSIQTHQTPAHSMNSCSASCSGTSEGIAGAVQDNWGPCLGGMLGVVSRRTICLEVNTADVRHKYRQLVAVVICTHIIHIPTVCTYTCTITKAQLELGLPMDQESYKT